MCATRQRTKRADLNRNTASTTHKILLSRCGAHYLLMSVASLYWATLPSEHVSGWITIWSVQSAPASGPAAHADYPHTRLVARRLPTSTNNLGTVLAGSSLRCRHSPRRQGLGGPHDPSQAQAPTIEVPPPLQTVRQRSSPQLRTVARRRACVSLASNTPRSKRCKTTPTQKTEALTFRPATLAPPHS